MLISKGMHVGLEATVTGEEPRNEVLMQSSKKVSTNFPPREQRKRATKESHLSFESVGDKQTTKRGRAINDFQTSPCVCFTNHSRPISE